MALFEEFKIYTEEVFVLGTEIISSVEAYRTVDCNFYMISEETVNVHAVRHGCGYLYHFPISPREITHRDRMAYGFNRKDSCALCYGSRSKGIAAKRLRHDSQKHARYKEEESKRIWNEDGWSFMASDRASNAPPRLRKSERSNRVRRN